MTIKRIAVFLIAALMPTAGAAHADPFEDGLAAAKRGEIATALLMWWNGRPRGDMPMQRGIAIPFQSA